jgi:hypothetical protein
VTAVRDECQFFFSLLCPPTVCTDSGTAISELLEGSCAASMYRKLEESVLIIFSRGSSGEGGELADTDMVNSDMVNL